MDPTDLNISTRVIPQVISVLLFLNVLARSVTVRETVKKSKASHVHAKKATAKKSHCWPLSWRRRRIGLGAFVMGGLRVVKRVPKYRAGLIWMSVVSIWVSWGSLRLSKDVADAIAPVGNSRRS